MSNKENIREQLKDIVLSENASIDLSGDDAFAEDLSDLGIDSLDLMMIMLKVDEAFGMSVKDETLEGLTTLDHIVDLIISESEAA